MVQAPAGRAAFEKLITPVPAVAVTVPPQPLTTLGVDATSRFAGRLSVKLPLMGTTLPFVIENVMVLAVGPVPVVAVVWMAVGLKLLVIEGGSRITMLAFAV